MDVRVGPQTRLSTEELMLLNCYVGEDSWESLGLQGDQTSLSLRKSSWIFIGRTDAKTETPILWPPDAKNWFIREKTLMLGKIEDRRRGWQRVRLLDGITDLMDMSLSKLQRIDEGQGDLLCCSPCGGKELDMSDWTELSISWLKLVQKHLFFGSQPSLTLCNHCIREFPAGSDGKESACNVGDLGSIPG